MLRKILLGLLAFELALGTAAYAGQGAEQVRSLRKEAIECQMRGELDNALMKYDQALELSGHVFGKDAPYLADLYFDAAMVALSCNRWQKAEECLNHTLKLNPNAITARVKLAELLKMRGRTREARRHVEAVLSKHKDAIEARQVLAMAYQEEGNTAKATREFFLLDAAAKGRSVPEVIVATMPPPTVPEPVAAPAPEPKPVTQTPEKAAEPAPKPEPPKIVPKPKPIVYHRPKPTPPPRKNRRAAPPKPVVVAKRKPPAQVASDVDKSITTRLRSKAVLLTKVGKGQSSEGVSTKTERQPVVIPPVYGAPIIPPAKRPKPGLVPPPPPNVPVMTGFPMPMMPMQPPPQQHAAKPKPKPVAVEAKESPKEEKHSAASSGGGEEDDFLLEWGEANKKKKKGR